MTQVRLVESDLLQVRTGKRPSISAEPYQDLHTRYSIFKDLIHPKPNIHIIMAWVCEEYSLVRPAVRLETSDHAPLEKIVEFRISIDVDTLVAQQ